MKILRSKIRLTLAFVSVMPLGGCGLGYYWQATAGHLALMRQSRPVTEVVADATTADEVRDKLEAASRAVDFAHRELALPDNGSYRNYADTGKAYVVWNVFAAPEFSLEARNWCFPVAGCVSYRGYFSEAAARDFAVGLSGRGDDFFVGGVAAYSTLGRFADPLLNTMMNLPDYRLAGLIFHELAHQRTYLPDDSKFNEGFASFVEREGVRRWLRSIDDEASLVSYRRSFERREQVQALLAEARQSLAALYDRDVADGLKRENKREIFSALTKAYTDLRRSWGGPPYFDHWFDAPMNNARLVALATYDDYVPAFRALLEQQGGDLIAFYRRVAKVAALGAEDRAITIEALIKAPQRDGSGAPGLSQTLNESAAADRGLRAGSRG